MNDVTGVRVRPLAAEDLDEADRICRIAFGTFVGVPEPAGVVTTSTASCPAGQAVELITIAGAGHQWPGAAPAVLQHLLTAAG
jgi:polyhydroxybutyrate depolymerase